jgi:iron complex outermembrane receptor protein
MLHFSSKRILFWLILGLIHSQNILSQVAVVKGRIIDAKDSEPLIGVNIQTQDHLGTVTNINGEYQLNLKPGNYNVTFKYIGYNKITKKISVQENQVIKINLELFEDVNQLEEMVISASKYEQKLGEVSVSMSIIKPELIENKATRDAESIIEQVPGVQINENQASIRGGSGWSYGAGSRVLVMVDGMPMLAGDANDIKWSAIPLENISQIEVLKGASSVLYGSSALNGVINIRTKYPKDEPITKINISNGFYMAGYGKRKGTSLIGGDSILDKRGGQTWWNSPRGYAQGNFTHLRKINENTELVLGGSFMKDQGYRLGSNDQRIRVNGGWKHFSKKYNGLSYGINLNNNFNKSTTFFLWASADSVLHALGGTNDSTTTMSTSSTSRIMIDPYISYISENGNEHQLKTRFFRTDNKNNTNQGASSDYYFSEYQFQKRFNNKLTLSSGAMSSYTLVKSQLYGDHNSTNIAVYIQGDKKWNKFNITAGMRMEYFKIDSVQSKGKLFNADLNIPFQPVFRFGATYQPMEYTFLRASYGQGYRFPSIAEKYISSSVGSLNVFPNLNIQPEYGWSAELGLKQGFKIKNFQGYLDISGFITQYNDMMEFIFGIYNLDGSNPTASDLQNISSQGVEAIINSIGARSTNVQNANIPGFEISLVGQGNLTENISFSILAGYTYVNPTAINPDSTYLSTFSNPDTIIPKKSTLKYRNKHLAKLDFQIDYKKFSVGLSTRYTSLMENVDNIFVEPIPGTGIEILPGYGQYRNSRMNGDVIFDSRIAYQINKKSKISILMNNLLNREYTNRPGNVMPPRTIIWQYSLRF